MVQDDDSELVARMKAGDEAAFTEIVHRYTGKVYGIGLSMLRNEQDARDIVQDTFLNVHRRIDSFRGEAPFSSWLGRIATNNALMKLRTRRRKPEVSLMVRSPRFKEDGEHERDIVDWSPLADKRTENRELGQQIRAAVAALPEKYRTVLVLADYQQLSMKQIAELLDLTVPNVKTRLHRARLAVREALTEYLEGEK